MNQHKELDICKGWSFGSCVIFVSFLLCYQVINVRNSKCTPARSLSSTQTLSLSALHNSYIGDIINHIKIKLFEPYCFMTSILIWDHLSVDIMNKAISCLSHKLGEVLGHGKYMTKVRQYLEMNFGSLVSKDWNLELCIYGIAAEKMSDV